MKRCTRLVASLAVVAACGPATASPTADESGSSDTSTSSQTTLSTSTSASTSATTITTTDATTTSDSTGIDSSGSETTSGADSSTSTSTSTSTSDSNDSSSSGGEESSSTGLLLNCGDDVLDVGEACDDGNEFDDDGCDADCQPSAVTRIDTALDHTCVLTRAGGVRCWGEADYGQLGYGNTDDIGADQTPSFAGNVDVGGVAVDLATGTQVTCAVLEGGSVRCWGFGIGGALGYGNQEHIGDDETPASAGDVVTGGVVIQVSASEGQSCILRDDAATRCWGSDSYGALGQANTAIIGDNETSDAYGDIDVGGDVIQISAGYNHTCALLEGGAVRCWGSASSGQLGYGNVVDIGDTEHPSTAGDVDVGGTVVEVSAGAFHTCARLDDGAVRCWGNSNVGQLGYANTTAIGDNEVPATAGDIDLGGAAIQITTGVLHTCALLEGGGVRCWGSGVAGRLGYGDETTIGNNETPASAGDVDVGGPVVQLSAGQNHTCAVLEGGTVRCWGAGGYGVLGYGSTLSVGDNETPASVGDVEVFEP